MDKSKASKLIGYKVTNVKRDKKYGIAANSLEMLKNKASAKFNVSADSISLCVVGWPWIILILCIYPLFYVFWFQINNARLFLAKDGTEVQDEEYFGTLEAQTLFIVATECDDVKTGETFYVFVFVVVLQKNVWVGMSGCIYI